MSPVSAANSSHGSARLLGRCLGPETFRDFDQIGIGIQKIQQLPDLLDTRYGCSGCWSGLWLLEVARPDRANRRDR
jgi:hypothetical protein